MSLSQEQTIQILADRLRGNGAWNGQGLLVFLASTSRKDPEREWMEPLKELAERVVYAAEDGEPFPSLTKAEKDIIADLAAYNDEFQSAIAVNNPEYQPFLTSASAQE